MHDLFLCFYGSKLKFLFQLKKKFKPTLKNIHRYAGNCVFGANVLIHKQNFTGCFFFFVSGLDFIGVEGSNYPRKFETAPGMIHPGA